MAAEILHNFLIVEPKSWFLGLFENGDSVAFVLALHARLWGFVSNGAGACGSCAGVAPGRVKCSASDICVTDIFQTFLNSED